ncbi:MAG: glycosyltransferase family 2 protein [Candidatus Woesearchaeota archaeon]
MKLSIVLPVYNEAKTLKKLMGQVFKAKISIDKEIIIIESNSTDGTREIVKRYEKHPLCKVYYQDRPRGKGNALKEGFKHVTGDIILIQDGDLEYDPNEYQELIQPILDKKTDFVLGSRHLSVNTHRVRTLKKNKFYAELLNFGHLLFTGLFNLLYDVKLTDPATMFKIFRKKCMKNIKFKSNYFELDWEIVAKLIRKGHKPLEVPVTYSSRSVAQGKKIRFFRDGTKVFYAIIKYRFFD